MAKTEALGKTPEGQKFGLVAYFDLMGASELFSSTNSEGLQSVLRYSRNYQRSASEAPGEPRTSFEIHREFVTFQDSFVRCSEIGWTPNAEQLPATERRPLLARWILTIIDELASLRDIQINFVCKRGLLLRGALAIGPYDVSEGKVHGPAFMTAFKGEKEARYPRILVDNRIFAFSEATNERHDWVTANVTLDEGNVYFIDYLRGASREAPYDCASFLEYLTDHYHQVKLRIAQATESEGAREKLEWMVRYHNSVVEDLSEYIRERCQTDPAELLIDGIEMNEEGRRREIVWSILRDVFK